MYKNVASQKIALFAFDTTTGAAKTGDAANLTFYVNKDWAGANPLTDTSATEVNSTLQKGWYVCDLSQTETNADVLLFSGVSVTANVAVVGQLIQTLPKFGDWGSDTILAAFQALARNDVSAPTVFGGTYDPATMALQYFAANGLTAADINAEMVDVLNVDTYAEPGQGAPPATTTLVNKIDYLYKAWRNRITQTATLYSLYNDEATTVDQKATFSDNGVTADRGEIGSGP